MTTKFKSGVEQKFWAQHRLPYETARFAYTLVHHYTPDWTVSPTAFIETKGIWTGTDRTKMLEMKKQHPHITVLMAFQKPDKTISKHSKTTYAAWCDKHGFQWCDATDKEAVQSFIQAHK